jgi:hypothetical protein
MIIYFLDYKHFQLYNYQQMFEQHWIIYGILLHVQQII